MIISQKEKIGIGIGVSLGILAIIVVISLLSVNRGSIVAQPANVQIVSHNLEQTGGLIFTLHYLESGTVINQGGSPSNPVVIQISVKDANDNTLFTTTTPTYPTIVQPGQTATFSKQFTTDDLGSYHGQFTTG